MTAAAQILSSGAFRNACERTDAACRAFLAKAEPGRTRFDREKAGRPFSNAHRELAHEGVEALWNHLAANGAWDRLDLHAAAKQKALLNKLDETDVRIIRELLKGFGWTEAQLVDLAAKITEDNLPVIYEAAGSFALGVMGAGDTRFQLVNLEIRDKLLSRADAAIFSHRTGIDEAMKTIVRQFLERGAVPHDPDFLEALRIDLDEDATWRARRFALTETGIASESAQHEVYARSGVENKSWQTFDDELTRDSHAELDGKTIPMAKKWSVGGNPADHPMDPALPARELVNCRCWQEPELEGKLIDEAAIWRGD